MSTSRRPFASHSALISRPTTGVQYRPRCNQLEIYHQASRCHHLHLAAVSLIASFSSLGVISSLRYVSLSLLVGSSSWRCFSPSVLAFVLRVDVHVYLLLITLKKSRVGSVAMALTSFDALVEGIPFPGCLSDRLCMIN